jgi:hypothetical protein
VDFESTIPNATKRELLLTALTSTEADIYRLAWACGNDPDTLSASYTAPAVTPTDSRIIEQELEECLVLHATLKTKRDAIPT